MAFVDECKAFFVFIGRLFRDFFEGQSRILKPLLFILCVILLAGGAFFGYRMYQVSQEQEAHKYFSEYLESFQTAQTTNSADEWERMVSLFDRGYQQHKARTIAPLFLVLKSDAQLQLGHFDGSIATLQEALNMLSPQSHLYPLLATKLALMQLDAKDESIANAGLEKLIALARTENNSLKDMALFYLGRYYWSKDNIEEARAAWQELKDSELAQKAYPSPWVSQAESALQQLAS